MKNQIILIFITISTLFISCTSIESEPPRADKGGLSKSYKLPDPKPLTAEQRQFIKDAKAEYDAAVPR